MNSDADALSRIDWNTVDPIEIKATMDLAQVDRTLILESEIRGGQAADAPFVMKALGLKDDTRKWIKRQNEDPEIKKVIELIQSGRRESYQYSKQESDTMKCYVRVRNELELENGLLYHRIHLKDHDKDSYQFVLPVKYRTFALELLHDRFGHLGKDRTTALCIGQLFWPKMADEVRKYIQNCERCIRFKQKPEWAELKPLEASCPLELVHMDFLKIGGKDGKKINVLVVRDHFTRYAEAYVTSNQQASTVAHVFVDNFVTNYEWPTKILTDQAKDFNGLLFSALCREAKIRKMRTSPYHPQMNGQSERFNRTLITTLGTLATEDKINWQDWLSNLTHAYNCMTTKVTGFSPYFLLFGREPRIPVDEEFGITFPKTKRNTVKQYVETLRKCLQ